MCVDVPRLCLQGVPGPAWGGFLKGTAHLTAGVPLQGTPHLLHVYGQMIMRFPFIPLILGDNKEPWNNLKQILLREFPDAESVPPAHTVSAAGVWSDAEGATLAGKS